MSVAYKQGLNQCSLRKHVIICLCQLKCSRTRNNGLNRIARHMSYVSKMFCSLERKKIIISSSAGHECKITFSLISMANKLGNRLIRMCKFGTRPTLWITRKKETHYYCFIIEILLQKLQHHSLRILSKTEWLVIYLSCQSFVSISKNIIVNSPMS